MEFIRDFKEYTFKNGKTITLNEPTLLQLQASQEKAKNDLEIIKNLLVNISNGDLDKNDLDNMPLSEFKALSSLVSEFVGLEVKN